MEIDEEEKSDVHAKSAVGAEVADRLPEPSIR